MQQGAWWFAVFVEKVDRIVRGLIVALMAAILSVTLLGVFFRYVLNASLFWGEEVARYLSVWMIFLSVSVAYRTEEHVRITALIEWLPIRFRRYLWMVATIFELLLALVLTWYGWLLASNNLRRGQLSPALQLPIGWVYMAIPVGFGLTGVCLVVRLVGLLVDFQGGGRIGKNPSSVAARD
jgi:TRAP-type C4-dicarboxylate transport system permease small subunit